MSHDELQVRLRPRPGGSSILLRLWKPNRRDRSGVHAAGKRSLHSLSKLDGSKFSIFSLLHILSFSDSFRKHLTEDLCPYTCLFPDCPREFTLYTTSEAWKAHMNEEHRSPPHWKCFACRQSPKIFDKGEDFERALNLHVPCTVHPASPSIKHIHTIISKLPSVQD